MNARVRPIRVEGDLAYLCLTKGYEAVIDAADVHLVSGWNWSAKPGKNTVYAYRTFRVGSKTRGLFLHRLLMGNPESLCIDHIDGDGLNNRKINLRTATNSQNLRNQMVRSNNTSGFKGVSFDKKARKWRAEIWVDWKKYNLGRFESCEAAAKAYAAAVPHFHGEFGRVK